MRQETIKTHYSNSNNNDDDDDDHNGRSTNNKNNNEIMRKKTSNLYPSRRQKSIAYTFAWALNFHLNRGEKERERER